MQKSLIAVMVTHNPPEGLQARVQAILKEVDYLIIVDNASDAAAQKNVTALAASDAKHVECFSNPTNTGLAAALNLGIKKAKAYGASWVLLLDHDSTPQPGMVATMLNAYNAYPERTKVGLIAPAIEDVCESAYTRYLTLEGKLEFSRILPTRPVHDEIAVAITSGSLIEADVFDDIGYMPEHFFIDYIDYDFCLRLRARKYRLLLVQAARLQHRLGEKTAHSAAGVKIIASNHSAKRRFTIFRNRIWLWKRFGVRYPGFVLHDLAAACYDIIRVISLEADKTEKLKGILRGISAGLGKEK